VSVISVKIIVAVSISILWDMLYSLSGARRVNDPKAMIQQIKLSGFRTLSQNNHSEIKEPFFCPLISEQKNKCNIYL